MAHSGEQRYTSGAFGSENKVTSNTESASDLVLRGAQMILGILVTAAFTPAAFELLKSYGPF